MIESGFGRTERANPGQIRREPRPPSETDDRDVREPRPLLRLIHTELLQTPVQLGRDRSAAAILVAEDEHADAAGLAETLNAEQRRLGDNGGRAPRACGRPPVLP